MCHSRRSFQAISTCMYYDSSSAANISAPMMAQVEVCLTSLRVTSERSRQAPVNCIEEPHPIWEGPAHPIAVSDSW